MGNAISRTHAGFGPLLAGEVDFAQLFEESIFATAPAIICIIAAILRICSVIGEEQVVHYGSLLWSKLLLGATLAGAQIAILSLCATLPSVVDMTFSAACFAVASSLSTVILLFIEHLYSYQTSSFLSLFLSTTWIVDVARTYSCFRRGGSGPICALYALSCATRFFLLVTQEMSKRRLIRDEFLRTNLCRESASGFWNRSLFAWVNSTLLLGFRQVLRIEDLPLLAPEFQAENAYRAFQLQWNKVDKASKYALAKACVFSQAGAFATIMIPRLCQVCFSYAQPFLILRITTAVREHGILGSISSGFIGATAFLYFGFAVTRGCANHLAQQVTTSLRGMLITAICDKVLRLSYEQLMDCNAITLMSSELNRFETTVPLFHSLAVAAIEIALGVALLAEFIGPACMFVIVPSIVAAAASPIIMNKMAKSKTAWDDVTAERVSKTSNAIAQIRAIKMAGLAEPVTHYIQRLRQKEIAMSTRHHSSRVWITAFGTSNQALPIIIAIAGALSCTQAGKTLAAGDIYTCLAILAVLWAPMNTVLMSLPGLSSAIASFPRIQEFLCLPEQVDHRFTSSSRTAIKVANASINGKASHSILRDINLHINQGDIVMISGPVGCGKSTLLKALIGEVHLQTGVIEAPAAPIGYADQEVWLENLTLRDNICHGDQNEMWYKQVLSACALDQDIETLPRGDQTFLGTNATNVSGGQKQRVALARAIYTQAPILVLDDPLSSVDAPTASAIVQRLVGEDGLLRRKNITVIMTTSSGDHCSAADFVFTVNNDGNIQRLPGLARDAKHRRAGRELVSVVHNAALYADETLKASSPKTVAARALDTQRISEHVHDERRKFDSSLYSYFVSSAAPSAVLTFLWTIPVASLCERMPGIHMRLWYPEHPRKDMLLFWVAILCLLRISCAIIGMNSFLKKFVVQSSITMHQQILTKFMSSTLAFLSEINGGSVLNRFSGDMHTLEWGIPMSFLNTLCMVCTVIIDATLIARGAMYGAIMVPAVLLVLCTVIHFYLRTSRQLRVRELEVKSPLVTSITEISAGIQHIRAFGCQDAYLKHLKQLIDYSQVPSYTLLCVRRWMTLVLDLCVCGIATLLMTLVVKFPNGTDESAVGLAMLTIVTFNEASNFFVVSFTGLEISFGSIFRIRSFCRNTPQEEHNEGSPSLPDHWPATGTIRFRNVSASYRKMDGTSHQVLNNISFTIKNGKKLGLSGRSGSGKSSVIAVLLRMIDYTGSVLVDGIELRTVPHETIRTRILSLTQDGIQLQGSVRFNVDPYDPPDYESGDRLADETLIAALTKVGLWQTILAGGGLKVDISELKLSQGQLQLLAIARAIVRRDYMLPKIVLIDEATSNIDDDTDRTIQTLFAKVFAHCTVIMISHRLYAFDKMNKVIMLEAGQVEDVLNRDPTSGLLVDR